MKANIPAAYEVTPKPIEELNLIDNFLFNKVLSDPKDGENVARILLETILGRKVGQIAVTVQQTFPAVSTNRKGSITDLLIREQREVSDPSKMRPFTDVYDIEPEKRKWDKENLPRRMRYYHSMIDRTVLPSGSLYKDLPDVYVIVITDFDPFERGRVIYTVENHICEEPDLVYNDGVKTIYLNAAGTIGCVRQEIHDLLTYMLDSSSQNAVNDRLRSIQHVVDRIKAMEEVSIEYMKSWEIELYAREEGREEERKNTLAEKQRADEEKQRADEEKQRADEERQRADEEKQRADEEKQRADDADKQIEILRKRIEELENIQK